MANNQKFIGSLVWYTEFSFKTKLIVSKETIVVSSFPSNTRHSTFGQLPQPTNDCRREVGRWIFEVWLFFYTEISRFLPEEKLRLRNVCKMYAFLCYKSKPLRFLPTKLRKNGKKKITWYPFSTEKGFWSTIDTNSSLQYQVTIFDVVPSNVAVSTQVFVTLNTIHGCCINRSHCNWRRTGRWYIIGYSYLI